MLLGVCIGAIALGALAMRTARSDQMVFTAVAIVLAWSVVVGLLCRYVLKTPGTTPGTALALSGGVGALGTLGYKVFA